MKRTHTNAKKSANANKSNKYMNNKKSLFKIPPINLPVAQTLWNTIPQDQLVCICDFDRTITQPLDHTGAELPNSVSLIRTSTIAPKKFREQAKAIYAKYRPYELDQTLSKTKKEKLMQEWWETIGNLYIKHKISQKMIQQICKQTPLKLRKGVVEFIQLLINKSIPLIIVSAGNYDTIAQTLKQHTLDPSRITIISNRFEYDSKGFIQGYALPVIHTCNKAEHIPLAVSPKHRYILVIGDAIEDAHMMDGATYANVKKIGFCLDPTTEKQFLNQFDIVLTKDDSFWPITLLIQAQRFSQRKNKQTQS
jgi:HAD superfamily hydrolase (TIGR01544 family)